MTADELRDRARVSYDRMEEIMDSGEPDEARWRRSLGVAFELTAEIAERLDILIAATGTRSLPIVGEIGADDADV